MNRTRRRRRRKRTRRRRRGGFKFKTPKFKMPKFKKPKLNITKKLGKVKDFGKKGLSAVGSVGKKGLGAVGKVGKMGMGAVGKVGKMGMGAVGKVGKMGMGAMGKMGKMAMANPMMAGLGGLGAAGALLASMGGIPAGQFAKIAKIGGMMVAPLLLLGSFLKPGASFVYQGLKQVVTVAMKTGKGGATFIINMVGMPIKSLMGLLGNMPMLMAGMGGFAALAVLVSKNYMTWIWKSWKFIVDGWASAPLFTWCEKRPDGTCRCPQILRVKKEGGKAKIIVEDQKKGWFSSTEGQSCLMNRQCPSGLVCKKNAWNPRGKCAKPDPQQSKKGFFSSGEGKGCFMNRQCPSGFVCKKSKWNPRGKCTRSAIEGVTQPEPMVTPPDPIVETGAPLVSTQPIAMAGGGRLKTMWRLEGETTGNGIHIKINKKSRRRRTRRKRGGKACPPPDAKTGKDKEWYREVGNCVQIRKTASGRTYKVPYPKDRACCPGEDYVCRIEGNGDEREPVCHFQPSADHIEAADFPSAPTSALISPALAMMMEDMPLYDERQLLSPSPPLGEYSL